MSIASSNPEYPFSIYCDNLYWGSYQTIEQAETEFERLKDSGAFLALSLRGPGGTGPYLLLRSYSKTEVQP